MCRTAEGNFCLINLFIFLEGVTAISSSYLFYLDKEWDGFHHQEGKEALVLVAPESKEQGKGGSGLVAGHHGVLASLREDKNGKMLYRTHVHYLFLPLE